MNLNKWTTWLNKPSQKFLASRIKTAANFDKHHFLEVHGATEAALRKTILIGLRQSQVTYKNAQSFLTEYDKTPSRGNTNGDFQKNFEILYGVSWANVLINNSNLNNCWELWLDYSKQIRNHFAHSVRQYDAAAIEVAITIDAALLVELGNEMHTRVGGSLYGDLTDLSPRLPRGQNKIDAKIVLGVRPRKYSQPKMSLSAAKNKVVAIDRFS